MRLQNLIPVLLAIGCGGNGGGGGGPDAALSPGVDAAAGTPDAAPGRPDAAAGQPDARPGQPDARPASRADAAPGQPDARPAPPDAAVPDAGPTCAGTWEAIPPLVIAGTSIVPAATTSDGDTLYYLYARPGASGYFDLASYSPATGWRAHQSTNTVDIKFTDWVAVRGNHFIAYYWPTDDTIYPRVRRGVLSLTSFTWSVTDPFTKWSTDYSPDDHGGGPAVTSDFLVFHGDDLYGPNPNGSDFDVCWDDGATSVIALDDPSDTAAAMPPASPLADRSRALGVGAGEQAFFWGGVRWPYPYGTCIFASPEQLLDGAFFDPAVGVWSVPISIPAITNPHGGDAPYLLWTGSEVLLVEYYDWGAHYAGRLHRAAPGAVSFQTLDVPGEMPLWTNENDFSKGNVAPVADGLIAIYGTIGYHFAPATNRLTELCPPPVAFPTDYDGHEPYGAVTSTGAVIARGGVAAYLHL